MRLLVSAATLAGPEGLWLMQRRPEQKPHGGLWEFPGGKVESTEMPAKALVRELHEELGIVVREEGCTPVAFAETAAEGDRPAIVILLYIVRAWEGTPRSLEGGRIDWFTPAGIDRLDKPPLDRELARHLFASGLV